MNIALTVANFQSPLQRLLLPAMMLMAVVTFGCNNTPAPPPVEDESAYREVEEEEEKAPEEEPAAPEETAEATEDAPKEEMVAAKEDEKEESSDEKEEENSDPAWGKIVGKFVYDGDPPAREAMDTQGKDAEACEHHDILDKELIVSEDGGIANVVIFAKDVSKIHPSLEDASALEPYVFDQEHCEFLSHVSLVRTGQDVRILNSDPVSHNAAISPFGDEAINPLLPADSEITHKFNREQPVPIPVTCNIHPWMKAWIFPRDNPYAAATNQEGAFEIALVPTGEEIEFRLWQEKAGYLDIDGWERGRKTIKLEPGQTLDLGTIKVAPAVFEK
ncbi:Methylamine utilization protein [Planctomycetales bacterium 10988]|nr:Methylamine utilization protein [Planctomycetales bacterium 10988]